LIISCALVGNSFPVIEKPVKQLSTETLQLLNSRISDAEVLAKQEVQQSYYGKPCQKGYNSHYVLG